MDEGDFFKQEPEEILLREGLPFVLIPVALALVSFLIDLLLPGLILIVFALFIAYFFRNPSRKAPEIEGAAVAPADGKVVEVSTIEDGPFTLGKAVKVSIFMSLLSVHINRMPIGGKIIDILYKKGGFRPAFQQDASEKNEQNALIVELEGGQHMALVQVAGIVARRIVCWVGKGERLHRGQRFGLIRFGSRVDCYLPVGFEVDVRQGQRVWGGETVLGYIR